MPGLDPGIHRKKAGLSSGLFVLEFFLQEPLLFAIGNISTDSRQLEALQQGSVAREADLHTIAIKLQRQMLAFGRARTPLEQEIDQDRIVVAGSQIFRIPKAWSFHEFLISYGMNKLTSTDSDCETPESHYLLGSLSRGLSKAKLTALETENFTTLTMDGDLYAFISFAYDMFTLSDNATVQKSLLSRVLDTRQFQGARYEVFVAASLIRAGFEISFEDESDARRSHCEFTATWKNSNKRFSVEVKSRHRDSNGDGLPTKAGMYRILQQALLKSADHERIVFADVNLPADNRPLFTHDWHREVLDTLTKLEQNQRPNDPWPQAMIFFTNRMTSPWPGQPDHAGSTVLLTAINHPLFRIPDRRPVEHQYPEIGKLFHATSELCIPPNRFFGQ